MKVLVLAVLLLSGCTINVVDKRLPREEVAQAFQQRDQVLTQLVKAVNELKGVKGKK